MLRLESPNLHEIGLDRVIAYGHTWSPLHELIPETPLRHGHAISIDMAYSATLANQRGLLSDDEHRRLLTLFSRAGLSIDHPQFDEAVLDKGTAAILKTRDGKLRLAVPSPLGKCTFINEVRADELKEALKRHKDIVQRYPRRGEGLEAYVDSSDTGYTDNDAEQSTVEEAALTSGVLSKTQVNGGISGISKKGSAVQTNGVLNGANRTTNGHINGVH
jgi:3-dehydroquinate synthase